MMWGFHEGMGWWMVFGGLWAIAFWAVVIGLVVWAVNRVSGPRGSEWPQTPLETAKQRFARGEISLEEFEKIRAAIQ